MNNYQIVSSWSKEGLKPSRINKILHVRYTKTYGIKKVFYILYNGISTNVIWQYSPHRTHKK